LSPINCFCCRPGVKDGTIGSASQDSQGSLARLAWEQLDLTQESNKLQKNDDEAILSNFRNYTLDN